MSKASFYRTLPLERVDGRYKINEVLDGNITFYSSLGKLESFVSYKNGKEDGEIINLKVIREEEKGKTHGRE